MPTFTRQERLKSLKTISRLFKEGQSFMAYPLRVVWLEEVAFGVDSSQMTVSVSKRSFKTAVLRNRLKRRIREAYRLHKHELYEKLGDRKVSFMLVYVAKEELPYADIRAGVQKMVRKFPG